MDEIEGRPTREVLQFGADRIHVTPQPARDSWFVGRGGRAPLASLSLYEGGYRLSPLDVEDPVTTGRSWSRLISDYCR